MGIEPELIHYLRYLVLPIALMLIVSREARLFLAGAYTVTGINCMYQDWVGLEAYLQTVATQWINFPVAFGLTLATISAVMAFTAASGIQRTIKQLRNRIQSSNCP